MKKAHTSTWILLLAASLMSGCIERSSVPLDKYLTRLGRSLDRPITMNIDRLPPLPRSRDLQLEQPSQSIGLLDLLALGGCEISITIGNLNSSLGKLASDSQRLLLELEFLSLAPACIDSLNPATDAELIATLQAAMSEKRRMLPARIWNATLGGPEFRAFWSRPRRLGNYPANTGGQMITSLARLAQLSSDWLGGNYQAGSDELERLLGDIRLGDGGALLTSLDLQRAAFAATTPAIQQRLEEAPICIGKTPSPEGKIVDNVVRKYFIGEVQPWSVQVARRRGEIMPPVLALELNLRNTMPAAYQAWSHERDELLETAADAPREHAGHLAALLESCGLRPGADSS
ncbi:DUF3080 family protein [Candidatus Marimicrobium litorale]|uniref:DUF3080 family protein n=1 Tax=Candidatus Marimicrobium litorale TaxID=2518991 RepID=A0ABT3T904_9GAMM|nr:DUF3080 family protein [Candidatus Marimicrobium litorale]MCX2978320.1 DUF3080 family protein [Candidatus Marimicrobium litorale]